MGRILLIAVVVVAAFFLLGSLLGLLAALLKWALIIGLVALAVGFVMKLSRDRSHT
jgi:hypothetical protein